MGDDQCSEANVRRLLDDVRRNDPKVRDSTAAQLSKVAAKAEDDILLLLSESARQFVDWLREPDLEPLVRAYTACILANIAFLEPGQQRVLEAGGVSPLVLMLKSKEDKKVTLHSTAAVQNLTYKNTSCCQEVLEEGGEKALKKLLQHKSEDVQQFAAGALANLQLYRRKASDEGQDGLQPIGGGKGTSMSRRVAKILKRKPAHSDSSPGGGSSYAEGSADAMEARRALEALRPEEQNAAIQIQSMYRAAEARKEMSRKRSVQKNQGKNKYNVFRVNDVRAELGGYNALPPLQENLHRGGMPGGAPRRPTRLAPLGNLGGGGSPGKLPGISSLGGAGGLPGLPGLPSMGGPPRSGGLRMAPASLFQR